MTHFFLERLDYIYFLYGLVLVLLGSVCFSMSRAGPLSTPWWILGVFGIGHGLAEWMQLPLMMGIAPAGLKVASTLLGAASYGVLLEFARRTHLLLGRRRIGPWIHVVLGAAVLGIWLAHGWPGFRSGFRLLVAWPAAAWTSWHFFTAAARTQALAGNPASRLARRAAGVLFGAYSVACGLLVPPAPFLPAAWPTTDAFQAWTGVPVQLLRTAVLGGLALSIWALAISFDRRGEVLRKRRLLFWATASSVGAILAGGWLFTDWLGRLYERDAFDEANSAAAQVHDHLVDQMRGTEGGARSLAQLLNRLHAAGSPPDRARLDLIVDAFAQASEGWVAYVLDPEGTTISTSNRGRPDSFLGVNYAGRPYFHAAVDGRPGRFIGIGIMSRIPGYFASEPVRGADGQLAAVAVVKRNLGREELGPTVVGDSIIVSGDGRALVTSRKDLAHRFAWIPRATPGRGPATAAGQGQAEAALLDHEVEGTEWVTVGGRRQIAVRRPIPGSEWSLLVLKGERTQVPNRLLGIVITLLLALVVLGFFVAMEHQLGAESRVTDQRREAEGQARDFARRADTDALTGVLNRLGFNDAFSRELERSRRYGHPLSVVMLDLDHFKRVNDSHGHAAGDQVLVGVARAIETNLRSSDTIGRWGGEEFVLLAPSTTAAGAVQLAEKLRVLMAATSLGPAGAVTGSFGVAELRPGDTCETLLKRADEAAYRAKHQGRNQVQCDEVNVAEVLSTSAPGPAGQRPMLDGTSMYAATGFLPIDLEHRALSQAIEAFFPMLSTGTTGEVLAAFESILAGVGAHFGHEQRLMQEHGYPGRARHAGEHAHFLEEAGALLAELESGGVTVPFRRWAVGRLPEWFRLHILEHDLQLGQFLAAADPPVRRRQTVVS